MGLIFVGARTFARMATGQKTDDVGTVLVDAWKENDPICAELVWKYLHQLARKCLVPWDTIAHITYTFYLSMLVTVKWIVF